MYLVIYVVIHVFEAVMLALKDYPVLHAIIFKDHKVSTDDQII